MIISLLPVRMFIDSGGMDGIKLETINISFPDFPNGGLYAWTWKSDLAKFGKGWLGQYESASPQILSRNAPLDFETQFKPIDDGDGKTWHGFRDFMAGMSKGKLEFLVIYQFAAGSVDQILEISVGEIKRLFVLYDKNEVGYTRFVQPSIH